MAQRHILEIWVAVDEDGDYAVSKHDGGHVIEKYNEEYAASALAIYRIDLDVAGPKVQSVQITAPEPAASLLVRAPDISGSAQFVKQGDSDEDF